MLGDRVTGERKSVNSLEKKEMDALVEKVVAEKRADGGYDLLNAAVWAAEVGAKKYNCVHLVIAVSKPDTAGLAGPFRICTEAAYLDHWKDCLVVKKIYPSPVGHPGELPLV